MMFWRRVQPAPAHQPARQTVGFEDLTRRARKRIMTERQVSTLAALTSGPATTIPDRDTVVAPVRARRAAQQEK